MVTCTPVFMSHVYPYVYPYGSSFIVIEDDVPVQQKASDGFSEV